MKKLQVIKIGGNVVDNPELLDAFLSDYAQLDTATVLVHGGGKIATKIGLSLGIEPNMIDGRRVTDKETIDLVTMVYAGLVNKNIVAQLQAKGVNAIGLTGADANAILSHKRPVTTIDYGFVGDIDEINSSLLAQLLNTGYAPVMVPITHDGKGQLLNTNADTIASKVAVGLASHFEVELVYCFQLPGVMKSIEDENSLIPEMNQSAYEELKRQGIIAEGMIPKMDNCFDAIADGVKSVRICHAQHINSEVGTKLF